MNPEYQINLIKPHSIRSHYRPQRSWGKVMFLQASVILLTGGVSASVHAGIHPPEQTPPEWTPPWSRHPLGADTPPGADTPLGADTPWEQTPHSRHPPGADPPGADTPWEQTHPPPGADTPHSRHPPGADTSPRSRACWKIRSTRGRCASYWNAILFLINKKLNTYFEKNVRFAK